MPSLKVYLERENISYSEFARRAKVSHARTIERIAKGQRNAGPSMVRAIVQASNGEVTANDLFAICETQDA